MVFKKMVVEVLKATGVAILIALAITTIAAVAGISTPWLWAVSVGVWVMLEIWALYSIRVLGPKEMGEKTLFGAAVGFCDSGPVFVPWLPDCGIAKFPKDEFQTTYDPFKVITKEGEYKGKKYSPQAVTVKTATYFPLPRNHNGLKKFLESGVSPTVEKIKDFYTEEVQADYRVAMANITWKEATEIEGRKKIFDKVKEFVLDKNSAFTKTGIETGEIRIVLNEINLDPKIEEKLSEPDRRKIEAEAVEHEAQVLETKIGVIGHATKELADTAGIEKGEAAKMVFERQGEFIVPEGNRELRLVKIKGLENAVSIPAIFAQVEFAKQALGLGGGGGGGDGPKQKPVGKPAGETEAETEAEEPTIQKSKEGKGKTKISREEAKRLFDEYLQSGDGKL